MLQYLFLLVFTSLFLFNQGGLDTTSKTVVLVFIILSVINIGGVFERRSWLLTSEIVRVLLIPGLTYYFFYEWANYGILFMFNLSFSILSMSWILLRWQSFTKVKSHV